MSKGKPARLQVDPESIPDDDRPPQTGHTFNIWYLKWAGGDLTTRNYVKLKFRVNIKRDSGYTKGVEHKSPICLFFARGCCYKGKKCPYIHKLPAENDYRIPTQDCFGRDKTTDYKDDMSGIGLLTRPNRTLYVSGIHVNDNIDDILLANFLEFGALDKVKVLYGKGSAFISYRLEAEAQFAKEAMDSQTLTGNDVLTVRWANEDPNSQSEDQTERLLEEAAMNTVKVLLSKQTVREDTMKSEGKKEQKSKKRKRVEEVQENEKSEKSIQPESDSITSGFFDSARLSALKKIRVHVAEEEKVGKQLPNGKSLHEKECLEDETKANVQAGPAKGLISQLSGYSSDEDD